MRGVSEEQRYFDGSLYDFRNGDNLLYKIKLYFARANKLQQLPGRLMQQNFD